MSTWQKQVRANGGYVGAPVDLTFDPYWDSVEFLLSGSGTAGTKPAADTKGNALSWSTNAVLTASASKFYPTSAALTTASVISNPTAGMDVGLGNWTVDGWFQVGASSSNANLVMRHPDNTATNQAPWAIQYIGSGSTIQWTVSDASNHPVFQTNAGTMPTSSWAHLAMVRAEKYIISFIGGVPVLTTSIDGTSLWNSSNGVLLGRVDGTVTMYAADVRFTAGIARWTDTFTPPTRDLLTSARRYPTGSFRT